MDRMATLIGIGLPIQTPNKQMANSNSGSLPCLRNVRNNPMTTVNKALLLGKDCLN